VSPLPHSLTHSLFYAAALILTWYWFYNVQIILNTQIISSSKWILVADDFAEVRSRYDSLTHSLTYLHPRTTIDILFIFQLYPKSIVKKFINVLYCILCAIWVVWSWPAALWGIFWEWKNCNIVHWGHCRGSPWGTVCIGFVHYLLFSPFDSNVILRFERA
jgi:hypothetical protein